MFIMCSGQWHKDLLFFVLSKIPVPCCNRRVQKCKNQNIFHIQYLLYSYAHKQKPCFQVTFSLLDLQHHFIRISSQNTDCLLIWAIPFLIQLKLELVRLASVSSAQLSLPYFWQVNYQRDESFSCRKHHHLSSEWKKFQVWKWVQIV